MQSKDFQRWLSQIKQLTGHQQQQAAERLGHQTDQSLMTDLLGAVSQCPHCASQSISHWGQSNELPRYRCKACRKKFNALTATPLARLRHKTLWPTYAEMMIDSVSICKAARTVGIDKNTAFRWRHRFLVCPTGHKPQHLTGIVEADETFFLESHKGEKKLPRPARKRGGKAAKRGLSSEQIPVLIIRDRSGVTSEAILPCVSTEALAAVMTPVLEPDAILCSDGHKSSQAFAWLSGVTHQPVNLSAGVRVVDKAFHVQNVNAYGSRLKDWMMRFHGVATKYLDHYLGWRRWLESKEDTMTARSFLADAVGIGGRYQQLMQT